MVRDRDLRVVAAAIAVSAVGDWVAVMALALRMHGMWPSFGVAAVFISLWSPIALLAGHVGVLVDRVETRALAIVWTIVQAAAAAALAFAGGAVGLLALTFALGVGAAVSQSAEFALLPLLAGSRPLSKANGIVESARALGFTVGPLIGGALAAGAGTRFALLADAATFLIVAGVLAALPVRRRAEATDGPGPRARDGVTFLYGDPLLAIAMTVGFVSLVFMSASIPGDFAFVEDVLGMNTFAVGAMVTVWAVGMVVASNVIPARIPRAALATATVAAVAVQGFAKFLPPFWLVYPFMLCCYAVGGAAHGVKNTGYRTLIHQHVPAERHGRAFAAYNGLRNAAELLALAGGGALVATVGGRGTLWIAGGAAGLAGLAGLVALSLRRDQPAASAEPNAS
jgi:MFS family permease